MLDLILTLAVVLFFGVVIGVVWLTGRHHRRTWGDGPQGQEPAEPYAPKTWLGQGRG